MEIVSDGKEIGYAIEMWREGMCIKRDEEIGNFILNEYNMKGHINKKAKIYGSGTEKFHSRFYYSYSLLNLSLLIDIPYEGVNKNVLGAVGKCKNGKYWIIRQGKIGNNKFVVTQEQFKKSTCLSPCFEFEAEKGIKRYYYAVACVSEAASEIQYTTSSFILECDRVRRSYKGTNHTNLDVASRVIKIADGSPERITSFHRNVQESKEILRNHTLVWQEMKNCFKDRMQNPRFGFSATDALIIREGKIPLLVEIKTDIGAASLQQGLGQLVIYSELLFSAECGYEVERVLLLPSLPQENIKSILKKYNVNVATYENSGGKIVLSEDFISLCGN